MGPCWLWCVCLQEVHDASILAEVVGVLDDLQLCGCCWLLALAAAALLDW
jgi:hypothetical protein